MKFTLPKPLHGWRAFWGEVGIIVLGVLIALAAQKALDDWQWRGDVAASRAALSEEIAENVGNAAERQMIDVCLRSRLSELLAQLRSDAPQWQPSSPHLNYRTYVEGFRNFPIVYRAPYLGWPSDVWDAAKAGDVLKHMKRDEVIGLSSLYTSFARMRELQAEEQAVFPELLVLGAEGTLDRAERNRAIAQIGRLHWANQMMIEEADEIYAKVRGLEGAIGQLDMRDQLAASDKKQRDFRGKCVQRVKPDV